MLLCSGVILTISLSSFSKTISLSNRFKQRCHEQAFNKFFWCFSAAFIFASLHYQRSFPFDTNVTFWNACSWHLCLNLFERLIVFEEEEILSILHHYTTKLSLIGFFLKTKSWKSNYLRYEHSVP